jgi:hypothetical protein
VCQTSFRASIQIDCFSLGKLTIFRIHSESSTSTNLNPVETDALYRDATSERHSYWVKLSHWIVTFSFLALAVSGYVILMCHPRLYWGEVGNDLTPALLELPISRNFKHGG